MVAVSGFQFDAALYSSLLMSGHEPMWWRASPRYLLTSRVLCLLKNIRLSDMD